MRSIRIFSPQPLITGVPAELTGTAARHVAQVLRMKAGDPLVLFDGSGAEFDGIIEAAAKNLVVVDLGEARYPLRESTLKICLWHGLCRSSRMDSVIQKATELGIMEIQPVLTEHGIVRLDSARATKKTDHWRNVAVSACEQSGRVLIPMIHAPRSLTGLLTTAGIDNGYSGTAIMCDPDGETGIGDGLEPGRNIVLLTGPEGGFSPDEKAAAVAAGFALVSLGPRVLRTETAPVAALSILQHLAGDL